LRRLAALAAATAVVVAALGAPTAEASPTIQKGIYDDAQILYGNPDKVFPMLQQMGTQVIRVNLWWGGPNGVAKRRPANPASPTDPAYGWDTYDRTVRYAQLYDMQVIFTVVGTPSWANASAGWNYAPTRMADLQSFVTAAAKRYSGKTKDATGATIARVSKWIAWNEPNNPVFLRPQFVKRGAAWAMQSPITYASMCNAVVKGVKSVYVSNKVACGVTSPRGNNQPGTLRSSVSPLAFMRAMKNAGAAGFDAYAHHPYYGFPTETPNTPPPPAKRGAPPTASTLGNFADFTRELARVYPGKRIWITEYGYQTNPPDTLFGVTPGKQALYMKQAWTKLSANQKVDMMIWFLLRDEERVGSGWQSGLYYANGKAKPARATFSGLGFS
jgi:putative glycosyl hydrolase